MQGGAEADKCTQVMSVKSAFAETEDCKFKNETKNEAIVLHLSGPIKLQITTTSVQTHKYVAMIKTKIILPIIC